MLKSRPQRSKIAFYALQAGDEWQLLVHCPELLRERIIGFTSKEQAENWPFTRAGQDWLRSRGITEAHNP
jgi:hypothetical protein